MTPDWGVYVIVAWLVWPDGHIDAYNPTTRFDEASCFKQAKEINLRWERSDITGFATCRRAKEEPANEKTVQARP